MNHVPINTSISKAFIILATYPVNFTSLALILTSHWPFLTKNITIIKIIIHS